MASILGHQHYGKRSSCLPAINLNCLGRSGQEIPIPNFTLPNNTQTNQEMKETEDVLASELNKLTIQERTKAMDDLHCVGEDLDESPGRIERSLRNFDKAVQEEHDPLYDMVASQNRAYVEDSSFRLRFIRANFHDVGKAVSQMLHFLRNKAQYFGTDCIGRDVTINDLKEEDRELLLSGVYHVQADRDQNGRVVVYSLSEMVGRSTAESLCRLAYYIYFNVLGAIPEVQMKGVVFIFYDTTKKDGSPTLPSLSLPVALMDMVKCIPIRFSAMHFCMKGNLGLFDPILKLVCSRTEEYSRVRTKLHYGSDLEVQYQLRGHGININSFPINSEGGIREDILNVWLQDYLKREESNCSIPAVQASESTFVGSATWFPTENQAYDLEALHHSLDHDAGAMFGNFKGELLSGNNKTLSSTTAGIEGDLGKHGAKAVRVIPTENDILLGRGKFAQNNRGNIQFRHFVENRKEEYDKASRRRRREIITEMSRILANQGVRFLKQVEKDAWAMSTLKETETKIAQLFREFRKQKY